MLRCSKKFSIGGCLPLRYTFKFNYQFKMLCFSKTAEKLSSLQIL